MNKYAMVLIGFVVGGSVLADEVDFSKAYVMSDAPSSKELKVGGIIVHSGPDTLINWVLLAFDPEKRIFNVTNSALQGSDAEFLEQRLRGTTWSGTYQSLSNIYLTELKLTTVQNGFVGGEIIHRTPDPEASNFLKVEVTGSIITQYYVDLKGNGELVWVNQDELKYKAPAPPPGFVRHLIDLKRGRGIEYRHNTGSWGTNSEYRMTLENNKLVGGVGIPPDRYSNNDDLINSGSITLEEVLPVVTTPPPVLAPTE